MKFITAIIASVIAVSLAGYIGVESTLDSLMIVTLTTLILISDNDRS